jgi:hypothetical protein
MSLVHQYENDKHTQSFLKENGEKFQGDAEIIMKLLYAGHRLTAMEVVEKYHIHDRRLRDVIKSCPNTVKKEWKLNEKGKRMYVEYFIPKFQPPTKKELQEWFSKYQSGDYDEPLPSKPTVILYPNENGKLIQGKFF